MNVTNSGQSYQRTWELTPYEMQRHPQPLLPSGAKIEVCAQMVQNELICPICLDVLKQTMTTKECLHRFCNNCITTALRNGNKECPSCRKKLVSKRSLRPDENFDSIVAAIYPNRSELDEFQESVLGQRQNKKKKEIKQEKITEKDQQAPCDFEIVCEPYPDQDGLVRQLKAQSNIKVAHLALYLHMRDKIPKLQLDNGKMNFNQEDVGYSLFVNKHKQKDCLIKLNDSDGLVEVAEKYGLQEFDDMKALLLYYKRR